jgi:hypothetical protein
MTEVTFLDGRVRMILGDCRDVLPGVGTFNAAVTIPPYDSLRDYGTKGAGPEAAIPALAQGLGQGGVIVWNVADQTVKGSETGTSFRQALAFMATGLRLHDTMIYCKESVTYPDANRYHPAFEYMFVFSKGGPAHFNGIRDWRNKWGGSAMHGTDRQPDGRTTPIKGMGREVQNLGLRRNWWVIPNPYTGETAGHPAPMPYRMAADHIETWTAPSEMVIDPFMGSGTTGVAAVRLGRRFTGIEVDGDYFEIACRRIEDAIKQPALFGDAA